MHAPLADKIRRAYQFFRSARMTAIIIAVLLLIYFLGLLIPQKAFIPTADAYARWKERYPGISAVIELLKLNDIYLAPLTIFLLALFFINLLVVMGHRLPVILRRMYLLSAPGGDQVRSVLAGSGSARVIPVPPGGPVDDTIRTFLKRRLWTMVGGDGKRTFLAVKNRYSPAGFLFFHASFLLCLIGGLLVMYTRFAGTLILTEGQEFTADLKQFQSISRDPKLFKALPAFFVKLERVSPRFEQDVGTELDVDLTITYAGKTEQTRVRVNQPVEKGPLSILAKSVGVSPLMVLRDAAGNELAGAYFSLKVLYGDEDSFEFPEAPYSFSVRFYPDFIMHEGGPATRSREVRNPVLHVKVREGEGTITEGLLPLKQQLPFDGLALSFDEVRYWVDLYVVREYGNYPLMAGFLLGTVGLIMRLLFYQKTLHLSVEEHADGWRVLIDGRSEYYPYSFRTELQELTGALTAALAPGHAGTKHAVS